MGDVVVVVVVVGSDVSGNAIIPVLKSGSALHPLLTRTSPSGALRMVRPGVFARDDNPKSSHVYRARRRAAGPATFAMHDGAQLGSSLKSCHALDGLAKILRCA